MFSQKTGLGNRSNRPVLVGALVLVAVVLGFIRLSLPRKFANTRLILGRDTPNELISVAHADDWNTPVFVALAFSGGGSRSAAFANSVLSALRNEVYEDKSGHRSLVDDVRLISSVSGGSVTAAWYGLTGNTGIDELRSRFIGKDNTGDLYRALLNPATLIKLAGPSSSRIDLVRELFDRRLFGSHTLQDIYSRPHSPLIILNATDMASGKRFSFSRQTFDELCSQFRSFPIATAVATRQRFL